MEPYTNPYEGISARRITRRNRYTGQQAAFRKLDRNVRNCVNTVILGPEGIGKSDFLNCYFNASFCRRLASEERILISRFTYPTALEEREEIFGSFAGAVLAAADYLEEQDEECRDDYIRIRKRAEQKRKDAAGNEEYLQRLCGICRDLDYQVILVVDQFEGFVNSPHVLPDHHNILRQLLVSSQLQMVVATDYDFNKNTIPKNASGSYLLQMFSGEDHEVVLTPFTEKECGQYLELISRSRDFEEEEIAALRALSGGIPVFLRRCAYYALEWKKQEALNSHWDDVRIRAYEDSKEIIGRWLKYLDDKEAALLTMLAGEGEGRAPEEYREGCLPLLKKRGLLSVSPDAQTDWDVCLNSVLLWDYCTSHTLLPCEPGEVRAKQNGQAGGTTVINVNGSYYEGDHNVSQTLMVSLPAKELLDLVTGDAGRRGISDTLYAHLRGKLPRGGILSDIPVREDDAEYDSRYDRAFEEQISGKLIGELKVDEEGELTEISEKEQDSLDQRFSQVRAATRPEVTDALLAEMSVRAAFYLKLAVVVEEALSMMRVMNREEIDCSAQLVLYGKALEQQLRDGFYGIFHTDEQLNSYLIPVISKGTIPFREALPEQTGIGHYAHGIGGNAERLGELCEETGIHLGETVPTKAEWIRFWKQTRKMVHKAREIRNLADHAGNKSPGFSDVDEIAKLCFGEEEPIFSRCLIGERLSKYAVT